MVIEQKLEYWKNRLLDTGKKNRFINCALPKSGGRISRISLLMYTPDPSVVWDIFSEVNSSLEFSVPTYEMEDFEETECGFEGQFFANGIRTSQSPKETCKTLFRLMKKSKEFSDEKGLNALFIAFGFLNWRECGTDGQEMRSPLLLIPVSLSQESLNAPILLSRSDEEISTNSTLEQKLLNDFGVVLPHFDEDNGWENYLSQVQDACSSLKWTVDNDVTQIAMFSFLKINMYRDLDKNFDKIISHPIVRSLNGETFGKEEDFADIKDYKHDLTEPQEVFSVVDADSSQQDAILLAKRGVSFVLQGPPGTGKSQTITNVIAELIADGKKVLFVSEKMAALEVVHKRLTQAGLEAFCLTLHSHNAKRREILDQLHISLELSRQKAELQNEAFHTLYQLRETRKALNAYTEELHTAVAPLGLTIFQVNGYLASYGKYKNIDYIQSNADSFTQETLSKCISALEELTRIVAKSGYQHGNPWNGCILTRVTHEFRQQFLVYSEKAREMIAKGNSFYKEIAALTGAVNIPMTLAGIDEVVVLLKVAEDSPNIPYEWINLNIEEQLRAIGNCASTLSEINELSAFCRTLEQNNSLLESYDAAWKNVRSELLSLFDENVLSVDALGILSRYRTIYRSGLARIINGQYRKDRQLLLSFCKSASKMSYEEALAALDKICNAKDLKAKFENQAAFMNDLLKQKYEIETIGQAVTEIARHCLQNSQKYLQQQEQSVEKQCQSLSVALSSEITSDTNFVGMISNLRWCLAFQSKAKAFSVGEDFIRNVCSHSDVVLRQFSDIVCGLENWKVSFMPWFGKFASLFEGSVGEGLRYFDLLGLSTAIKTCSEDFAALESLIDYRNVERLLVTLGIDSYLAKAKELNLAADEIVPVFRKCFYRSWLDMVMPKFPSIHEFRRERQDGKITQFQMLDKAHLEISKAALIAKLIARLPNFDSFSENSGEIALLRREMAKQRKLMPTRKLLAAIPNLLPHIKPCMMMSPLSVSTYLGSSEYEFDAVIFDEASQVRTEDAICSIFRAKQVIIAGDSKQLPPTDFFASAISDTGEYEENEEGMPDDTGAYESLLDEAAMLATQTLLWHYRSKHEHLIAFSNAKIYHGNLITFPSSVEKADGMGVEYIHVPEGIYKRGGKNGNRKEAEQVAELVFEHFLKNSRRSLGIIAFGEVQQTAIEEAILRKRRENPQYESFFRDDTDETLFVKNLETVQGDERDTIIFSIGYAPDASGKFIMNFGPLSRNGGERRLNVAVTRARYNLKLVGSILPTDIDVERTSGQGPKLLRLYIDFAINGTKAILGEITASNGGWFDSPFEESVYNFLTGNGYDVAMQVGCSGYRVDLAVRHPQYNGRYAIGIECDGAAYHSARTARERDRLRQSILEDMGWKIYRVWSTDWIKDPYIEGERLLAAVREAVAVYREESHMKDDKTTAKVVDFLDISEKSKAEIMNEKYGNIRSRFAGYTANEIPASDFEQTMLKVLSVSFGLDKDGLFKETARYGYLWARRGSTIKQKFESAYQKLISQKKIIEGDDGKIKIMNNQ